jgi:hypothetical protein
VDRNENKDKEKIYRPQLRAERKKKKPESRGTALSLWATFCASFLRMVLISFMMMLFKWN